MFKNYKVVEFPNYLEPTDGEGWFVQLSIPAVVDMKIFGSELMYLSREAAIIRRFDTLYRFRAMQDYKLNPLPIAKHQKANKKRIR